ncbi:MAG: IS1634 family transposase [Candidatus Woesearchaeota archaeon]
MKQLTLRVPMSVIPTKNISFPIGTALAVQKYSQQLEFEAIFSKFKAKGIPLAHLVEALLTYRLTENGSTSKASDWINRSEVLKVFHLHEFDERTLFRVLETVGANYEEIILLLQDRIFELYNFLHTNTNLDWTSFILWGTSAEMGEYGYSRDHRPDKKQITVGLAELANPINIPIGLTIQPGNENDQTHFSRTFNQIKDRLKPESRICFDKGGQSKNNLGLVLASKMKYLSAKKLNTSDDKRIKSFSRRTWELVDPDNGIYGTKIVYPSRIDYFFFSEKRKIEQVEAKLRKAEQMLQEAKEIQASLDFHRKLPKRFRINNPLVEVSYTYQTKLKTISEADALKVVQMASLNGREGFFCLVSSENLTLLDALKIYRMKDSIEKIFQSLKNDINIKPLRVWSTNSLCGAILIGFLAQLVISLLRYDHQELKHISPKSIKISLMNLTVTTEFYSKREARQIYSNFEPINTLICAQNRAIT